jgi:antitoxin MazE
MTTNVQQWGNSLALRIPKALAEMSDLEKGSSVELSVKNGQLVVKPVKEVALSLDELVAGITTKNRHAETDWGAPQGRELL